MVSSSFTRPLQLVIVAAVALLIGCDSTTVDVSQSNTPDPVTQTLDDDPYDKYGQAYVGDDGGMHIVITGVPDFDTHGVPSKNLETIDPIDDGGGIGGSTGGTICERVVSPLQEDSDTEEMRKLPKQYVVTGVGGSVGKEGNWGAEFETLWIEGGIVNNDGTITNRKIFKSGDNPNDTPEQMAYVPTGTAVIGIDVTVGEPPNDGHFLNKISLEYAAVETDANGDLQVNTSVNFGTVTAGSAGSPSELSESVNEYNNEVFVGTGFDADDGRYNDPDATDIKKFYGPLNPDYDANCF